MIIDYNDIFKIIKSVINNANIVDDQQWIGFWFVLCDNLFNLYHNVHIPILIVNIFLASDLHFPI